MATRKKATPKKVEEQPKHIGLVQNDSWLEPYEAAIQGRHDHALWKISQLTRKGKKTLSEFATGHLYFGLHKLAKGWVFREWAPNATEIYLVGDFNDWKENDKYKCKRIAGEVEWWRRRAYSCLVPSCGSGRQYKDFLRTGMES